MKKDIQFLPVKGVNMAVAKRGTQWDVYLINRNGQSLENVMVTSRGYGEKNGEKQKTSTLRHMFPLVDNGEAVVVEPIDPGVFHLTNEYWVSYFIGSQVYDRKYIFVPDSILEDNLTFIEEIGLEGVLHP